MPPIEATAPPRERTRLAESNVRDALAGPLLSQDTALQQNWEAVQRFGSTQNVVNKTNLFLNQLEQLTTFVRDNPGTTPNPNDYSLFAGLSSTELQALATGYSSLSTDERNFFQLRAIAFFVNGAVEIQDRQRDGQDVSWFTLLQEAGDGGQPRVLGILETARQDVAAAQASSGFLAGVWDWITGRSRTGPVRTEEPTTRVATVPVPTQGTPLEEISEDDARRVLADYGVDLDSLQDIQFGFEDIVTLFYANSLQARLNGIFRPQGGAAPVVSDEDYYAAQAGAALDTYTFLANNYSHEELAAHGLDVSASAFATIPLNAIGSPEDRSRVQLAGWNVVDIWDKVKDETAFWNLLFIGTSGLARALGEGRAPVWQLGVGQINEVFAEASRILNRDVVGISGDPANPVPNKPLAIYQAAEAEVRRLETRLSALEAQRAQTTRPEAIRTIQTDIAALTPELATARQALTAATPPLQAARAYVQQVLEQLQDNITAVRGMKDKLPLPAGYSSRIDYVLRNNTLFTNTSVIIGNRDVGAIDSVLKTNARGTLNAQNAPAGTGMRVEFELLTPSAAGGDIGRMSARLAGTYEPSQNAFARVLFDPFRVVGYAPGAGTGFARVVGIPFRIGENTFLELAGRTAASTHIGQRLGAGGLGLLICAGIEYGFYKAGGAIASHWEPPEETEEAPATGHTITPVAAGPTAEQRAATVDAERIIASYTKIQEKCPVLAPVMDAYLRSTATIGLPRSFAISVANDNATANSETVIATAGLNMPEDRRVVRDFLSSVADYLATHQMTPAQAQAYFYQRYFERHSTDVMGLVSSLVPESGRLGVYKEFFTSVMRTWPGDENMVNTLLALPAFSSVAMTTINTKFPTMASALQSLVTSPSDLSEWYGNLMVYAASPGNERLTDKQMLDYLLKSMIPNIDLLDTGLFTRTEISSLRDAAVIEWARIAVESGQDLSRIGMNTFYPVLARYMSSEYPALRDILDNITALPADGNDFKMLSYRLLTDLAAGIRTGAVNPNDLASAERFFMGQFNAVYPGQTVLNSFNDEGKLTIVLRYLPHLEGAERRTLTTAEMESRVLSDESLLPLMAPEVTLEELQQRHAAGTLDAATFISVPEAVQMAYWNWLPEGDSRGAQASRRVLWTGATDAWREDHSFLKPTGRGRRATYGDWPEETPAE